MHLFDAPTLLAYLAAAVVLVLLPGPGTAWILAQSFAGGTKRGIQAGLGLETATLLHALAAGLGLSALLATSAMAFEVVKYLGAAYLVWLGIKAWRNGEADATTGGESPKAHASGRSVYLRSVVTGVLNPKVALFFLAFLPQFVHPERGWVWLQFLVLGALLAVIGFCNDLFLSFAAGRFGRRFSGGTGRWTQRVTGTLFIGLGLRLAMQQRG
ncbi:LysE family translocator [Lysobacter arvi]|uniref:LysE family translocator n=1 Tax=Lysobacter arvi TaxID=3038776 RepID=A0ABU1CDD0_9GAMM|nr:LysE family translocator [Lysobacter arvi]MDR0183145.1 LysE family translocator [Lysobacter arvi]